ncbi:MAG: pyridoxal-phosphate dependent enzyme [Mariprofundus sp.]
MHKDSAMDVGIGGHDEMLSRTDCIRVRGRNFFIKRDDLIDPLLSGNKYRKLYSLIQTPADRYRKIMSYGGTQSNAMLSIAALCYQKGWQFHYTARSVPARLKKNPAGNLKTALELGMQLHEVAHAAYEHAVLALPSQADDGSLFMPQGGADPLARHGVGKLAQEIRGWRHVNEVEKLHVVIPSGTGTTAYFLATNLPEATVLTTASVADTAYLTAQMNRLGHIPDNLRILENSNRYHFARPCPELLTMYRELKSAGIEFDLIYAPHMWNTLLQYMDDIDGTILYIHSGGLSGNETMLDRYAHKNLL